MRVTIGTSVYRVHIDHKHYDPYLVIDGKYKELAVSDLVTCVIKDGDTVLGVGERYCSVRDTFDLHRGRREALASALREGAWPMDERKAFWEVFVATLPKKSQVRLLLMKIENLRHKNGPYMSKEKLIRLPNGESIRGSAIIAVRCGDPIFELYAGKPLDKPIGWRVIIDYSMGSLCGDKHYNTILVDVESQEKRDALASSIADQV